MPGTTLLTTLLLLALSAAAPVPVPVPTAPAQRTSQQCRCAVMPATTPFFPSLRTSPSPTSSQDLVTDSCAALGPQLQSWRDAAVDRAAEEAARLEKWILEQDEKVARAGSDLLWGKRPIPTAAALMTAKTQHSDGRPEENNAKARGRIVCRSVEVADEASSSFEDALYADTTTAERARKTEAQDSSKANGDEDCAEKKSQKLSFLEEILDAWHRPERHMFALKLVVFVLVMLCMIELGEDVFIWFRRRRQAHRGIRLSDDEKAWYRPGLEPIAEVEEEDDTQLP
ncbi:hypothetical protein GTA08_BOTSDO02171 [Neofusicoccum parvum]|uniref:Uncharacterized protein n=2 Tax=Neofusicoccum parvum TaxID=310453 RepID=R1EEG7_BOTPV|nr:hypothetical protein UCRNP2_7125 [Neofusicoccum parvum UCRNP2]GME36888.1 hypothetical protein GTA08_BOTSDO02171 [Neofusicoccum parvum]GME53488.1 hypothetical protein GTA08_BOTSDO02171 [Neofusicoccum parvum]